MNARETVLRAVKAALGRQSDRAAIAAEAEALLTHLDTIRPALPTADLLEAFAQRALSPKVNATIDRIQSLGELPAAVRRYLAEQGLPPALAVQPDPALQGLDWSDFELHEAASPNEAVALGRALWGIAETGSLVFHSGADTAVLNHFLPLHHIATLRADRILPYLEDYAAVAGPAPRNVNLITGASGTTDIEGSYVRGAHGPRFLHIILTVA